jgi:phage terminase Nu1 subunit (DNA packaging protein)
METISTKKICEHLGIHSTTLHRWKARGCPSHARGQWILAEVVAWRRRQEKAGASEAEERRRLLAARADLAELQRDTERGLLIDKGEADRRAFAFARGVRDTLLGVPDRLGAVVAGEADVHKCTLILREEINHVINQARSAVEKFSRES